MPRSKDDPRRHVQVQLERIGAVAGNEFPGHYPGEDHSWNLKKFNEDLVVSVQRLSPQQIEFDLVGVDSSIANAIRRILIAEVPTMAFESIYVWNNTSIMQDEVLCHRIGLVPLKVDPRKFEYKGDKPYTDKNSLVFDLRVRCDRKPNSEKETDPRMKYYDSSLYAGMLSFGPQGAQKTEFADAMPCVVQPDILLCKLRPGQVVDMDCFAIKGTGADHAKFSPVATASYRLLPHISILEPIPREHQAKFVKCFPEGVVEIREDENGEPQCEIVNPRKDTVSREVLRHDEFKDKVELSRIRDHFLFSVESAGQYDPQDLVPEAIKIMLEKIANVEKGLDKLFAIDGVAA